MTWGQLRLQLQASAPSVSLDLIDEYLNTRYSSILDRTAWQGLEAHSTIQTVAAYESGTSTATLTVGSATVTGSGTAFSSSHVGRSFYRPGDSAIYTVAAYSSPTLITLDRGYEGSGNEAAGTVHAGCSFVVMLHLYTLPADCKAVVSVLHPATALPMPKLTKQDLDAAVGSRANIGDPSAYCPYDDLVGVLQRVEFYPPPRYSRGYVLDYIQKPSPFSGSNTSDSPVSWVTDTVLLNGCRADIQLHLKDFTAAAAYEGKFARELAQMLMVDANQKQAKQTVKLASRFTRHRLLRTGRGNRGWGPGQGGPY